MLLTRRFFIKEQRLILMVCITAAALIGSIQTAFIIKSVNKEK